ncbi:hypothetical protein BGC33_01840, partial [Bathymodiolus thermophilus thioautotrophic gill symbiont]
MQILPRYTTGLPYHNKPSPHHGHATPPQVPHLPKIQKKHLNYCDIIAFFNFIGSKKMSNTG